MEITQDYIQEVFNGKVKHKYYEKTKTHYRDMGVHISGKSPDHIIDQKRPNEPDYAKDYRLSAYKPTTKSESEKVLSVISRIFNEKHFGIKWPDPPSSIKEEDYLKSYMMDDYPFYRSLLNYVKQILLKKTLEDPNAVLVIYPLNTEIPDNEYYRPVPIVYNSNQVLDFDPGVHYVIDITEYDKNNSFGRDDIEKIMIINETEILQFQRKKDKFEPIFEFAHGIGEPPVFRLGGIVNEDYPPYCYESFISGVLPHWDKAVMTQSDLDAMIILHMYPEKWEMETECTRCGGRGEILENRFNAATVNEKEKEYRVKCPGCQGSGYVTKSPFEIYTVKKDVVEGDVNIPIPPMGYVDRPVEVVSEVREILAEQLDKGLEAINMDIIKRVGENQSGVAKTIDRQDLDSFLQKVSDHFFDYLIPNIIRFTYKWREGYKGIKLEMPNIIKPVRFDVLSANMIMAELSQAKEAGIDNSVVVALQKSIVDKMFTGDIKEKLIASLELDPFPGMAPEEILTYSSIAGIDRTDLYIKANLQNLVNELSSDEEFLEKEYTEKREMIYKLATEKLKQQEKPMIDAQPGEPQPDS